MNASKFAIAIISIGGLINLAVLPSRANHNRVNGCGDSSFFGKIAPHAPVGANFRPACNNHDLCYGELSQSKEHCDRVFYTEMLDECGKKFKTTITRPLRSTCNAAAAGYYGIVKNVKNAETSYNNSQQHARSEAFRWSQAGAIAGRTCVQFTEPSDPNSWQDNYLCSDRNFGLQWSNSGSIAGMKCTQINEDTDPNGWQDNYLCLPSNSPINFKWSQSGSIVQGTGFANAGMTCTQIIEDKDPHTWQDNYLCY